MRTVTRLSMIGFIASILTVIAERDASAQYAVAVQPVAPAVVGYAAQRRGLWGRRVVLVPVVGTVAVAAPPITSIAAARSAVAVQYAPAVAPVATYYGGPPPVAAYYAPLVPVQSYRLPLTYLDGF